MADNKNNIGVITEQGFVMGEGLGFKPVKKKELENQKVKDKKDDNEKVKPKK